ncbi:MAG: hypothetical protein IK115_04020 [Lachnospiraceae bacterium]|nr:hypothetical protein [Lachnospiraceae bacterium]
MTGFGFGIIMFICIVPVLWISFAYLYPKKWKERKLVLGVNNRKEFKLPPAEEEVEAIVMKSRRQALYISISCTVISALLLLLHGYFWVTFVWTLFIFAAIFLSMLPFILGHRDMMAVKRRLGIVSDRGVSYVDLKMTGSVHALKIVSILIPDLFGLAIVIFAFLINLGAIKLNGAMEATSFLGTVLVGVYWLVGLLFTVIAFLMDNMKNSVISTDSDINVNYNRAKKKTWADLSVACVWLNTVYLLVLYIFFIFRGSEMLMMISIGLYILILMIYMALFVRGTSRIEARYQKEISLISDDDEYWIGGMLYYNPEDRRLMVEKHAGIGGTVNFAHPGGKIVGAFLVLSIAVSIIWLGMLEATPIRIGLEGDKLVCHQLRDEYVIPLSDMETVEWIGDTTEHSFYRVAGVGMVTLLKGDFSVDGKNGCKVFLNPADQVCIRIVTKSGTEYYISGAAAEESRAVYEELIR